MLQLLRQVPDSGSIALTEEFAKDLNWFNMSLSSFNGVVMFPGATEPEHVIYVDSSLFAFDGVCGHQAYHLPLSQDLQGSNISFLELLNIYVALQYWAVRFQGSSVLIHCDNMAAVYTLTYFRAASPALSAVARNIWSLLVKFNITAEVKHIPGKNNGIADRLSRLASEADISHFRAEFPT